MSNGEGYRFIEKALTHDTDPEVVKTAYGKWAKEYEKNVLDHGYVIPKTLTAAVVEILRENNFPKDCKIMDLGGGTGLVSRYLMEHGYRNVDGLDLCPEMLQVAVENGLYRNTYCEALGEGRLLTKDWQYDVVTASGLFTYGHVKPSGFDEALHITRPGGIIAFTVRGDIYNESMGYPQKIKQLEASKRWVILRQELTDYDYQYEDPARRKGYVFISKKI